jgi:hypothetical protein
MIWRWTMSDLTADDIIESVKAKSDQINADDLVAGAVTGRIVRVTKGSAEQPVNIYLDTVPGKAWRPCKSERRILIEMWGNEPSGWKGQGVRLHRDPTAKWEGKPVGGVRIEAATIPRPLTTASTVSRGKKQARTIGVLQVQESRPEPTHEEKRARLVDAITKAGKFDDADAAFGPSSEWDAETCAKVAAWLRGGGAA